MSVRRKLIAGNWKMNGSRAQLAELSAIAAAAREAAGVDVAICPPFTLISLAAARAGGLAIGAQDCHQSDSGAHTGNVSAPMLKEAGARLTIVGHSERRADQHESDALVSAKAQAAIRHGLRTIVCVGESEADRAAGRAGKVVSAQLSGSLPDPEGDGEMVVAYEPIWAIGTGKSATTADVAEMHALIRAHLIDNFGDRGGRIRILYGGSVKAENAAELFAVDNVDGALVGGASLTAEQFVPIIQAAARC
ncbi:triose-phosphate isomerase [Sphingosinicella rhizophila]|uniref:Triosephosphate isomerase n=1 Tax=Sphingosinicella rhizophila TaxID=3050082 RepID=A0ABU3Q2G6_9SPHN|nr:triose-phosphate isomerase [Sphingosinicella sp. GR2756]MDT9597507.1 triose-phosphate isomerase [Sphingosinicella sp. GR2756]